MPTYRIPVRIEVYVNAGDARLALAVFDDSSWAQSFQVERIAGGEAAGEPVEVEP